MDVISTSLEALIQRATSNHNVCPDRAAIEAFCGLINREPECTHIAARFITAKVHSLQELEALQALNVLDACMKNCGSTFHAEVGKFRFLNELIKLVSPKYLGAHTPEPVRKRVLELMHLWTMRYPKETKIKEAYEMLKKQGVVKEDRIGPINLQYAIENMTNTTNASSCTVTPSRQQDSIFQDEEKSRLLQKLLQSKNPNDLQVANRLIKSMVKEDEKRVEQKTRHITELDAVHNNAKLLNEMLDSYRPNTSSEQDLELIKELHASCLRLRPKVFKLASEVNTEESLFNEVLAANDELGDVFDKFTKIIVQGKSVDSDNTSVGGSSLLDLSTPSEELLPPPVSLLNEQLADLGLGVVTSDDISAMGASTNCETNPPHTAHQASSQQITKEQNKSDYAELGEIFTSPASISMLQPVAALNSFGSKSAVTIDTGSAGNATVSEATEDRSNKLKALEDLDILGATLLMENLPQATKINKVPCKVPMNQLNKVVDSQPSSPSHNQSTPLKSVDSTESKTFDLLIGSLNDNGFQSNDTSESNTRPPTSASLLKDEVVNKSNDLSRVASAAERKQLDSAVTDSNRKENPVKPLGDINITLESIKPGSLPPRILLDEKNGITVTLHTSQSKPRPDVTVFVVTTTSKNSSPLTDYLFQPVVPKTCRLRLQPPTATELPAHNPFLPPSVISQVMLIASATQNPITLKFVVSYTMDEETMTEMGEATDISLSAT